MISCTSAHVQVVCHEPRPRVNYFLLPTLLMPHFTCMHTARSSGPLEDLRNGHEQHAWEEHSGRESEFERERERESVQNARTQDLNLHNPPCCSHLPRPQSDQECPKPSPSQGTGAARRWSAGWRQGSPCKRSRPGSRSWRFRKGLGCLPCQSQLRPGPRA